MKIEDKNKALAELLGITTSDSGIGFITITSAGDMNGKSFNPYLDTTNGLAQFGAITLRFPEDILSLSRYEYLNTEWVENMQANVLDEVIRANGKWTE